MLELLFFRFPQHKLLNHEQILPAFAKYKFIENWSNIDG